MNERMTAALPVLMMLAACVASPERAAYEVEDLRARWLDRFLADKRACERAGGIIVQTRHAPDSIRVGGSQPEVGTRYGCARR